MKYAIESLLGAALGVALLAGCGKQGDDGPLFNEVIAGAPPMTLGDVSAIKPPDQYQPAAYEKIELNFGSDFQAPESEAAPESAATDGPEAEAVRESLTQLANSFQEFNAQGVLDVFVPEQVAALTARIDPIQQVFTALGNFSRAVEAKLGAEAAASGDPVEQLKAALGALDIDVTGPDQAVVRLNAARLFAALPPDALQQMEAQGMTREMLEVQLTMIPPIPMRRVEDRWRFELPMTLDAATVEGVVAMAPNIQGMFERYTQQINETESMTPEDFAAMMQQMQFEMMGMFMGGAGAPPPDAPAGDRFGGP